MVTHLAVDLKLRDIHVVHTLCGRDNKNTSDGLYNSTDNKREVDCKLCIKILGNPRHWRYRKYLSRKEE